MRALGSSSVHPGSASKRGQRGVGQRGGQKLQAAEMRAVGWYEYAKRQQGGHSHLLLLSWLGVALRGEGKGAHLFSKEEFGTEEGGGDSQSRNR